MNFGSAPSQAQRLRDAMAARQQAPQQARAGLLPAQQPAPTAPTQSPRPAPAAAPVAPAAPVQHSQPQERQAAARSIFGGLERLPGTPIGILPHEIPLLPVKMAIQRATGIKTIHTTRDLYEQGRKGTEDYEATVQPFRTQRLTPFNIPGGESIKQGVLDTPSAIMTFVSAAPIASQTAAVAVARRPETAPALLSLGLGLQVEAAKQDPVRFAIPMLVPAGIGRASRVGRVARPAPAPAAETAYPFVAETFIPGVKGSRVRSFDVTGQHAPMIETSLPGVKGSRVRSFDVTGQHAPMIETSLPGVKGSRVRSFDVTGQHAPMIETSLPGVKGSRVRSFDVTGQHAPMIETSLPGVKGSRVRSFDVTGQHAPMAETFIPGVKGSRVRTFDIEAAAEIGGVTVEFAQLGLFRRPVTTGRSRTIDIPERFRDTYGGARQIRVPEYGFEWTRAPAPERAIFGTAGTGTAARSTPALSIEISPAQTLVRAPTSSIRTGTSTISLPSISDITGIDAGSRTLSGQIADTFTVNTTRTTTRQAIDNITGLTGIDIITPRLSRTKPRPGEPDIPRLRFPDIDTPAPKKKRKKKGKKTEFDEFLSLPDLSSSLWRF